MLQFDAAPVVTSIPSFVNGEEFYSRGRKMARRYARQGRRSFRGVRLLRPAREAEKHLTSG
jgi:hypothetical protein